MRAVPSSLSWAPVTSAPWNMRKTSAFRMWVSVCSCAIIERKSASTTASTAPAISTGSARRCQKRPPAASMPLTRTSPPFQRSEAAVGELAAAARMERALIEQHRAGPGIHHAGLEHEHVGVLVAVIA